MTRKTVAILVVLFSSAITLIAGAQQHMNYSVLAIEYIGPADHLIGPIVISDSKEGAEWFNKAVLKKTIAWDYTPEYVVSSSLMRSLISEAEVHHSIAQKEPGNAPQTLRTVRVTLVTPKGQSGFLTSQKLASSMLESFKVICKDNEPLQSEFLRFQREILP